MVGRMVDGKMVPTQRGWLSTASKARSSPPGYRPGA
jgi:hypothetical protein